jgi:hypothetical protein
VPQIFYRCIAISNIFERALLIERAITPKSRAATRRAKIFLVAFAAIAADDFDRIKRRSFTMVLQILHSFVARSGHNFLLISARRLGCCCSRKKIGGICFANLDSLSQVG